MSENLPAVLTEEQQLALLAEAGSTNDFTRDDLMIPSLRILQSNSREVKRSTPEYVAGAAEGMFFINVTGTLMDAVTVIPVKYLHVVREFESGDLNARMVKDHGTNLSVLDGLERDDRGRYFRPNGGREVLVDSALYYLLALTPDGVVPCAMRLGSTQWRAARKWNTVLQNLEMKGSNGRMFRPPMYARSYDLTSRSESNDDNTWSGYSIAPGAFTFSLPEGADLFARAKALREAVDAERVVVAEDMPSRDAENPDSDPPPRNETTKGAGPGIDDEIPFAPEWR